MDLKPVNPYHIIEELTKEVAQLKEDNTELRKIIAEYEEDANE